MLCGSSPENGLGVNRTWKGIVIPIIKSSRRPQCIIPLLENPGTRIITGQGILKNQLNKVVLVFVPAIGFGDREICSSPVKPTSLRSKACEVGSAAEVACYKMFVMLANDGRRIDECGSS